MMCAAVVRVLWIVVAVELEVEGGVARLAVTASLWRLFIRVTRRSRRTDGGGMLVGRTMGGEVVVEDMKLRVGGVEVEVDAGDAGFGFGLGLAGAGVMLGPSVKSSQASKVSSSHGGCGGGWIGSWTFFGAGFTAFAGTGAGD